MWLVQVFHILESIWRHLLRIIRVMIECDSMDVLLRAPCELFIPCSACDSAILVGSREVSL